MIAQKIKVSEKNDDYCVIEKRAILEALKICFREDEGLEFLQESSVRTCLESNSLECAFIHGNGESLH